MLQLKKYLEGKKDQPSTKTIRDYRAEKIAFFIDEFIQYSAEIRDMRHLRGWSASTECKLPRAQQLWLDPSRPNDQVFSEELEKGDWREELANQFAQWLNRSLEIKKLPFGDVEHREWKSLLEQKLRLFKKGLENF
jgi:CRISPR-associated protein Csy1